MARRQRPSATPAVPVGISINATLALRDRLVAAWRDWDAPGIELALAAPCAPCAPSAPNEPPALPLPQPSDHAHWRGLAAFMQDDGDALAWLDLAYSTYHAAEHHLAAGVTANAALVICLVDSGAMNQVARWIERAHSRRQPATGGSAEPGDDLDQLWQQLGSVASVALGQANSPAAAGAATWLQAQLHALQNALSAHERLLVALVLIEYEFAAQRYEQFDALACQIEVVALFNAAAPMLRARWLHIHGFAHYQAGDLDRAEQAWRRSSALAAEFNVASVQVQSTLALARLMLDRGRLDEAERAVQALQPQWGAGRTAQLIQWQQLRARVQLLRGQAVQALASIDDALRLADVVALPPAEQATGWSIRIQALVALQRFAQALELLARLADEQGGRDAQVSRTQLALLRAWTLRLTDRPESQRQLALGLALAQACRFTMFFRLLPDVAAGLCALALRWDVAPLFVMEVIRARALPAPADADARWPWPVWLKLLGGFELHGLAGSQSITGKSPHKPLELLRLLACAGGMALRTSSAAQALWPEAQAETARKNLEMAVSRLRRWLGDASLLWVAHGRVGLDAARISSDVAQRRRLIERLEALARQPGSQGDAAELMQRVFELSQGELLAGLPATPWLEAERRHSRRDIARAASAAASLLSGEPLGAVAQQLLEAALRIEPLAEPLVLRLMQAHAAAGQRGQALSVFEHYRQAADDRGALLAPQVEARWRQLLNDGARRAT